jgi:hypothetical protein
MYIRQVGFQPLGHRFVLSQDLLADPLHLDVAHSSAVALKMR